MVAVFTVTVAIVVVPWKNTSSAPAQVPVNRYAMLDDGRAVLVRTTDGNGHLLEFESRTIELLPGLRALNDLPLAFADAVAEHIAGRGKTRNDALSMTGRITGARVADMLRRKVAADGTTSTEEEVQVLDGRGLFVLGFRTLGSDPQPTIAEPALQLLPPDPRKGDHWSQTGTIGSLAYQWEASISDVAPATATLGSFDDCLTVTSSLTITDPAAPSSSQLLDVYCAGVGAVTGSSTRTDGEHRALDTVAVDDRAPAGVPDVAPSVRDHAADGPAGDPSGWVLSRVGSALPISTIGAETVPPVYLPTQPPSVLASTDAGGDLVSLDLGDVSGSVAWRFPTAGAIYSEPRYDAARGRIYVGATDGRLRALDSRGLFLWSTPSGDNVATRPAVANDTVVFGSEDGAAYGVDATTGERRWRTKLTGAAASSPAVSGDVVAIGDDGATVTGLDTGSGTERWTYAAGDAVEAPVGLAGGDFLVADRSGALARLDPVSGEERWTADAGRGSAVRVEPVLFGDLVLAVDDSGTLSALDAATGDVRWRHRERGYVGSPAMVGTDAIVASADGRVHVIDASGNVVATIETQDARGGAPAGFDYGPTVGGGMLWLADKTGTVWRLGPAAQGSSQLAAAWLHASVDAPFAAFPFVSSAVAWRDSAVVLDTRRHSFFIDPTSGTTTAGPVVGKDGDVLLADPVVAGDTLLIDAGSRLLAVDLPSGAERWSQPLVGTRYLPPAVQGNTVVTISDDPNGTQIQAFALDSGQLLWTAPTTPAATKGQPLIGDGVVFAGSPVAAYDLATGAPRWTSTVENPSGGMARSSDGRMLFVATLPPNAADGQLIAVNVADGALAWSATTTGQGLLPLSRLIDLGQTIVLSSFNGSAHGYDAGNGTELWHKEFPSSVLGGPAAIGERAWFALQSGQVAVLDATGTVTASFQGFGTSINAISVAQHPAEVGGVVVIPGGSTIFGVKEAS